MIAAIQDETIMALYKIRAQLIQEIEEPVDHLEGAQPHHEDVFGATKHRLRFVDGTLLNGISFWATAIFYFIKVIVYRCNKLIS